ncbi:poly [ADP-ribose] polymerase 2-A-like [Cotesia glomerata]|uniref:poly [ADP-ribose] polymerase 2-A-like n=1 Tax=Cotesia glomerata TaxID=32391 RepID=UPI001D01BC84|nr:poly [ADP-ribose] polymerase 2-A-like [Cotesia glomerata]
MDCPKKITLEEWERQLLPSEKVQKLIDNCTALKMEPDLVQTGWSKAYVYTTAERKYSQIWTKEDVHDNEPIYYYYRIQILGLNKDGYNEEGNYLFVQNWGAFDTINHRKRSDYLPLRQCLQKFMIQSGERSRNYIFAKIKENDISKNDLPELVQELIAKYIFDVGFLKKMIGEYTFDVKNTISAFLEVTSNVQEVASQLVSYPPGFMTHVPPRVVLSYQKVRELLKKQITCEPTDKINGGSRTFSLMNFYYKQLPMTINFLDRNSERYKIIEKYFTNSQSMTSVDSYILNGNPLKLKYIFEIERPYDNDRYTKDFKNKQLLWHGTKRFNIPSILYEGFKISKAKRGLFGAGTYFTNAVTKSWRYCGSYLEGVLFLCEVALGEISTGNNGFGNGHQENPLPVGKNSVHGVGNYFPNINDFDIIDDDVLVPYGRLEFKYNGGLEFDEFIVYNTSQIKRRYLVTF